MTFRSIAVLIVFLASVLFVIANWGPIMTTMPVSFILFTVNAPFGLLLILGGSLVFLICLLWMLWKQATALVDLQKANREARKAREEAENAEGSRVVKFEDSLKARLDAMDQRLVRLDEKLAAPSASALQGGGQTLQELQAVLAEMKKSQDSLGKTASRLEELSDQRLI